MASAPAASISAEHAIIPFQTANASPLSRPRLAAWWYRRWLHTRVFDPSGAELDYTNAQIEAALALLALGISAVGVALVLRGQRRQRRAAAETENSA